MLKLLILATLVLFSMQLNAQTAEPPSGDGSSDNPYQIETLGNLYWISQNEDEWDQNFIQTSDIDANDTENWSDGEGWQPIGYFIDDDEYAYFSGIYDGQDYIIEGLYIDRSSEDYIGLFGVTYDSTIENLGLVDIDVSGDEFVGGLVGYSYESTINNSSSTGNVSANCYVGILVGSNVNSIISNSHSTGDVTGYDAIGGLVGVQLEDSNLNNSYSSGDVSGDNSIGGLVGGNTSSTISESYSTGSVTGGNGAGGLVGVQIEGSDISNSYSTGAVNGDGRIGGLVGENYISTISNSYSIGSVDGDEYVGGLLGLCLGTTTNSYWNTETSGQMISADGEGRTTEEMTYPYADNTYVGWDFEDTWVADEDHSMNNGYPYLQQMQVSAEDDYIVSTQDIMIYNYPNPFNPDTTIYFELPNEITNPRVEIFNLKGRKVRELQPYIITGKQVGSVVWDGKDNNDKSVSSGVYLFRLKTDEYVSEADKMMLVK